MFRRKEESLFDDTTDPNQESVESSTVSSSSGSGSGSSHSSPSSSHASAPSAPPPAAPTYGHTSMPRPPGAPQPASSFRPAPPASPLSGDLSRNRMPESPKASLSTPLSASSAPSASSAADKISKSSNSGRRVLTVGNDILLKGEIATCDRLVIEGKVDATLNDVHTVEIAENGSFKGSANIEDAEISGLFEGDLVVRNRLIIFATGKVRGKITYGEIEIERGGELTGEIKTNASGSSSQSSSRSRQHKDDKVAA